MRVRGWAQRSPKGWLWACSNRHRNGAIDGDFDSTSLAFAVKISSRGGKGPVINSVRNMTGDGQGGPAVQPCLFLLFRHGERPSAAEVRAALRRGTAGLVSYDPGQGNSDAEPSDWLEVVVEGLTFDLLGLAPGRSLSAPEPRHRFGQWDTAVTACEAIGLAPGPHLAGAANAMPVARTLLRLGAGLSAQLPATLGSLWLPAGSAMRRDLFVNILEAWFAGGAFPALGLTGIEERQGGVLASDGLAFFTGQEAVLDASLCTDRIKATRLLTRLIDRLVDGPPLHGTLALPVEGGGRLRLSAAGPVIHVSSD